MSAFQQTSRQPLMLPTSPPSQFPIYLKGDAVQGRGTTDFTTIWGDTVRNRGHPEDAFSATLLSDLNPLYGRREIRAGGHPVPNPIKITFEIRLEHLNGFTVDARGASVGFHASIRCQHCVL